MSRAAAILLGRTRRRARLLALLRRLGRDRSGLALIEFAYTLPVLLTLGLLGADVARLTVFNMQVSQVALSLADNASRLGQTDNSGITPTVREADVDAVIDGALRQGAPIDLQKNGRVILSSFEYDADRKLQYIHWQRCRGGLGGQSSYGNDSTRNGLTGPRITGLGQGSQKITVGPGTAVMFVEITYRYDPLLGTPFGLGERMLRHEGAFLIRDDRNLTPGLTGSSDRSRC